MRNKNKGMTLIEVVTTVAVFAMILVPLAHLSRSLVADIPNSYKLYQLNTSVLHAIQTLRDDIAKADDIVLENDPRREGWTLRLAGASGERRYVFGDGFLLRGGDGGDRTWELPRVKLELKMLSETDARAVELCSYISIKEQGKERKKLENNYIFYASQVKESLGGAL